MAGQSIAHSSSLELRLGTPCSRMLCSSSVGQIRYHYDDDGDSCSHTYPSVHSFVLSLSTLVLRTCSVV